MTAAAPNPQGPERGVFVSYASQDASVANAVVEALERNGIRCWIAPRDVKAGAQYADAIVGAINDASAMVLVLSNNAIESAHVAREVERTASKKKPVLAFRIDSAPLSRALEYFLSNSQWIDVPALGMPLALARLKEALGSAPPMTEEPVSSSHRAPPANSRVKLIAVTGGVLALGVAAAWGLRIWPARHADAQSSAVTPAATISDKSIAVLPFADMSEKHDQEYFGDGMAEEILDLLAKIPGLTVIGRTSSFSFKGKNEDLRTIGTRLNAAYVLEGSVRKSGNTVRITAQLINTRTGAHEWSETYDRPIGDVLKLQDEVAAGVARELQLRVVDDSQESRFAMRDAGAYDLLLRGRYANDRWDHDSLEEAVTLLTRSSERDPTSAEAALELGRAHANLGEFGYVVPPVAFEAARRAALTALSLDPRSYGAHVILGDIHVLYDWDWNAAEREYLLAATLAPGSPEVLHAKGFLSLVRGRWDDALRDMKAAVLLDPLGPTHFANISLIEAGRGRLLEAEAAMRQAIQIRPNYNWAHYFVGVLMLARSDRSGALVEMQRENDEFVRQQGLAIAYSALGRRADSDTALARMMSEQASTNAFGIGMVYAMRGQPDQAMHWLERGYAQKEANVPYIKTYPELFGLKQDPRFKAFLRKMNLPE